MASWQDTALFNGNSITVFEKSRTRYLDLDYHDLSRSDPHRASRAETARALQEIRVILQSGPADGEPLTQASKGANFSAAFRCFLENHPDRVHSRSCPKDHIWCPPFRVPAGKYAEAWTPNLFL